MILVLCQNLPDAQTNLKRHFHGLATDGLGPRLKPTGQTRGRAQLRSGVWSDFQIVTTHMKDMGDEVMGALEVSDLIIVGEIPVSLRQKAEVRLRLPRLMDPSPLFL